jgi:hypothetical protein
MRADGFKNVLLNSMRLLTNSDNPFKKPLQKPTAVILTLRMHTESSLIPPGYIA